MPTQVSVKSMSSSKLTSWLGVYVENLHTLMHPICRRHSIGVVLLHRMCAWINMTDGMLLWQERLFIVSCERLASARNSAVCGGVVQNPDNPVFRIPVNISH